MQHKPFFIIYGFKNIFGFKSQKIGILISGRIFTAKVKIYMRRCTAVAKVLLQIPVIL